MTTEQRITGVNLMWQGMEDAQSAIACCEEHGLLRPIWRLLYNLCWVCYHLLLNEKRNEVQPKHERETV
jgi:hypothetical protein